MRLEVHRVLPSWISDFRDFLGLLRLSKSSFTKGLIGDTLASAIEGDIDPIGAVLFVSVKD